MRSSFNPVNSPINLMMNQAAIRRKRPRKALVRPAWASSTDLGLPQAERSLKPLARIIIRKARPARAVAMFKKVLIICSRPRRVTTSVPGKTSQSAWMGEEERKRMRMERQRMRSDFIKF